jgi:hypothetical protein
MGNPNFAKRNLLSNEVYVDLNMLGATMLHWIGQHVDGRDNVIVDKSGRAERSMKLLK